MGAKWRLGEWLIPIQVLEYRSVRGQLGMPFFEGELGHPTSFQLAEHGFHDSRDLIVVCVTDDTATNRFVYKPFFGKQAL